MVRYVAHVFFTAAMFFLTGCAAPQQPAGPTELCVEIPDRDQFIDRTLSLLRLRDFQPSFVDRTEALIVAGPTTSGQWLEPWRSDVIGPYQLLESSLHTIRRTVSIEVKPLNRTDESVSAGDVTPETASLTPPADSAPATDAPSAGQPNSGTYRLRVTVEKARLAAPNRQATTAIGLLGIYSPRLPTVEGARGIGDEQWVALGRDGLLEQDLLTQISRNLTPIAAAPEPAEPPAPQ
ncbi:MAG: hypothetical protein IT450_05360 [Phycisphaerales bacterium]|nr:hypothetical protein [Phycisphaerales bacterium]